MLEKPVDPASNKPVMESLVWSKSDIQFYGLFCTTKVKEVT